MKGNKIIHYFEVVLIENRTRAVDVRKDRFDARKSLIDMLYEDKTGLSFAFLKFHYL